MRYQPLWESFSTEREKLQIRLTQRIKRNMASLVGNIETADLLLVAADGRKLPAHLCILRQRAPVFFDRYIQPTFDATPRDRTSVYPILEVAIGDVDSAGLAFFIRSVYTEEEVANLPGESVNMSSSMNENDDGDGETGSTGKRTHEPADELNRAEDDRESEQRLDTNRTANSALDSLNGSRKTSAAHLFNSNDQDGDDSSSFNNEMTASYLSNTELHPTAVKCESNPLMTSFRELASSESQLCVSGYSDISQLSEQDERENKWQEDGHHHKGETVCKFSRLDSLTGSVPASPSRIKLATKQQHEHHKSIFPMFFGMGCNEAVLEMNPEMSQSFPLAGAFDSGVGSSLTSSAGSNSIRSRAMNVRKLSVTSLSSLSSIGSMEMTPTLEGPLPPDQNPACRLASDLLQMYMNQVDTDLVVVADDGELLAHRCILSTSCESFQKRLKADSSKLVVKGYSKQLVHFLLTFLYGGLTCIADDIDVWEIIALGTQLDLEELVDVGILHLRTHKCHFFHRPCATCVSAVFDALPQFSSLKCLRSLYDEALCWQARHFTRIWKGRVFFHLSERWQRECFNALLQETTEENVIDVLLGCEKLQVSLPRAKAQQAAQVIQQLVVDVVEYCMEFLANSLDLVISSKSFANHGKGFALNLSLLEDIFPVLIHSLPADTAIRAFINIKNLIIIMHNSERGDRAGVQAEEWNPRFLNLCRRVYELIDKHLLHYAASVTKSAAWDQLTSQEQSRINEAGIFVEMKMARAPPPKLSSFNRTYKRSSSAGAQPPYGESMEKRKERSVERASLRPISTFSRLLEAPEPIEESVEREKSQSNITVQTSNETVVEHPTKIPARVPNAEKKEKERASPQPKQPQHSTPPSKAQIPRKSLTGAGSKHKPAMVKTLVDEEQNKEAGINPIEMGIPAVHAPATSIVKSKPQSVVRPMPKNPSTQAPEVAVPQSTQVGKNVQKDAPGSTPTTSLPPSQTRRNLSQKPTAVETTQAAITRPKAQQQSTALTVQTNEKYKRKTSNCSAEGKESKASSRIPRSPQVSGKTKI